jgi:hypothetical protein
MRWRGSKTRGGGNEQDCSRSLAHWCGPALLV